MCGIVGICNFDHEPVSSALLRQMTDTLTHRGPDGEGYYTNGPLGFGHRRLSIIDLSSAGRQPMPNETEDVLLIYNGEIYNFRELRANLEEAGHQFRSKTDSEVIVHAYEEWGDDCVDRFNGMFAFAIWDERRRRVFMARDRYGIKPLYYYHDDERLLFASEVKALLEHPALSASVDPQALLEYFTFQNVFTDRTLFDGVRLLPGGHTAVLEFEPEPRFETRQYWDFDFSEPATVKDLREYEEELDRLFRQAVRRQLVSDVPVGSYLSGGMDSGAITAIASQEIEHLTSFTGGFDLTSASGREKGFDERDRAEELSYRFGTEQYEVVMKAGDMERALPELTWHLEDLRVGQSYPNYYVARLASKFVKVVLAGTGGDELFAGYPWRYYRAVNNNGFEDYVQKYYSYWQRLVGNDVMRELFRPELWRDVQELQTIDIFRDTLNHDGDGVNCAEEYVNRSLYLEAKTFLHGLFVVEDKLSMAHGLETRVPFMDNDLVDFAQRVPVQAKLRDLNDVLQVSGNESGSEMEKYLSKTNDGKMILRSVLGRYMPDEYVKGVKQGFSAPDASWFRDDSIDYVREMILDSDAQIYDYLRRDTVQRLVEEHLSRKRNRRLLVWSLLNFEWWCRKFIA